MSIPNSAVYKSRMRGTVYLLNFIFALQMATVGYFGANYLKYIGLDTKYISFVFALVSLVATLTFFVASHIFNKIGAYRAIFIAALLYALSYIIQAYFSDPRLIIPVFILGAIPSSLIVSGLDALMERFTSSDEETGGQRGLFITMASAAFVAGPFIGGLLAKGDDFKSLWLAGAAFFLPFLVIAFWKLQKVERIKYKNFHILKTVKAIIKDKDAFNVFMAQFVLYFFYSVMVIYTSVYLREFFNMPYDKIGLIFAFALLPFVFLTVPLGKIADKILGEQEIMIAGFAIMAIATFFFAINENPSLYIIALLLFATRIGASFVQTMTETYFFKLIDGKDADMISAFRAMYPLASIAAPLIAGQILFYANFRELYVFLALFSFVGIFFALKITDTK